MNWIIMLLGSVVVSAIVSGITSYLIEKRKYNQDYWKISIEKRLEVYDQLEQILVFFQSTHLINNKPCHLAFMNLDSYNDLQTKLAMLTWKRNWLSTDIFKKILELNRMFSECNSAMNGQEVGNFGVKYYSEIAHNRDEILKLMTKDYLNMSDVKGFYKSKITENFSTVWLSL